ncbi:MAG: hypothetical protein KatS3mg077_3350 [Candidatus Binatia bacterium]|nr:MAG: hypothetical protein KatS3mg077_3350 [Candidatus Binatia bacterium]
MPCPYTGVPPPTAGTRATTRVAPTTGQRRSPRDRPCRVCRQPRSRPAAAAQTMTGEECHRRSIRLQGCDYTQGDASWVTIVPAGPAIFVRGNRERANGGSLTPRAMQGHRLAVAGVVAQLLTLALELSARCAVHGCGRFDEPRFKEVGDRVWSLHAARPTPSAILQRAASGARLTK